MTIALDRADSAASLIQFVRLAWHQLEPKRAYVHGWHIDAMCEHLEAVTSGEIRRLLINVPPGFMKSLLVSVLWPAWEWGPKNRSDLRYIAASYHEALSIRDNLRTRTLITAPWYQQRWGSLFRLTSDQNEKKRFDNNRRGWRLATSTGGLGTGERADRGIIDDPHNVRDGESQPRRESTLRWLTETFSTRLNDPETSPQVMIMQRVHEQDCSAVARELGWDALIIPMEHDGEVACSSRVYSYPKMKAGDLAWPERYPRHIVEELKRTMGSYAVAAQFQQRPAPRGGGLFKREWFTIVDAAPRQVTRRVRGWDLAATEDPAAPRTSGVLMASTPEKFYILDVVKLQGSPEAAERAILNTASRDGRVVRIDLPQDPGQAGKSQVRYYKRQLAGYVVRSSPETGDKVQRAEPLAAQAEAGNVALVRGDWVEDFLDEACNFPRGRFKDQIDAASRAFAALIAAPEVEGVAAPEAILG